MDILSYILGKKSGGGGGQPDPQHWAPKTVQNAVFNMQDVGLTWPVSAEEGEEQT